MASYLGKNVHVSIFGQSHAQAIGVTIDGLPVGEEIDLAQLRQFLARRSPGQSATATARREADQMNILCGLHKGYTCGAPLCAVIENADVRSGDYAQLQDIPRPAHADFTAQVRYGGFQDAAGGGHFSGRLTAPLCIAGGIALQILQRRGIAIDAHIVQIGSVKGRKFDPMGECEQSLQQLRAATFPALTPQVGEQLQEEILKAKAQADSVGGVIECMATGLDAGLGDGMFGAVDSRLSAALFGIPAVKGVEFGAGFDASARYGSENNDPFVIKNGEITTASNHAGGILGGISTGLPLVFSVAFKPTPSIGKEQNSVSMSQKSEQKLVIHGRHDPCIVPRAVPVVEAATAIVLLDLLLDAPAQLKQ